MYLNVLSTSTELESIASEWTALLQESARDVPFLQPAYLNRWWQTRGGGEWSQAQLQTVVARADTGQLLGIAPFFLSPHNDGRPTLLLLGSIEISDYLDLVVRPQDLDPFIQALFEYLAGPQAPAWQVLDLYNLLEDSPTLPALQAGAQRQHWRCTLEPLQHCPYIQLPGNWETYLAGIDKKQRHEIRRKMRRLQESPLPYRWYIVTEAARLDDEIDAFLELMAQDTQKERFLTAAMRTQMQAAIRAAFEGGWLQLAFIEIDGQKAAAYLNFDYNRRIWVYNSGLNLAYREYSPGWVLLGHLLQWANENERQVFDFLRGDEEYKYRFGAIDRRIVRVTLDRQAG